MLHTSIGSPPIDLMLNQISTSGTISISWTPPPAPPSNGYRITVYSEDFSSGIDTMSSSQDISVSLGVHTMRVQSRSIHFPGGIAAMDITVLGKPDSLTEVPRLYILYSSWSCAKHCKQYLVHFNSAHLGSS